MEKIQPPELDPLLGGGGGGGSMCPYSWVEADGSCFKLFGTDVDDGKTWSEAETMCQKLDAHLASISSRRQHDTVAALLDSKQYSSGWIGLTDTAMEGSWVWSDGELVAYTNWASTEPDNALDDDEAVFGCTEVIGIGQDCARITVGGWFDSYCELNAEEPGRTGYRWEDPDRPGCYFTRHPYVCSKPATSAVASGGDMYGCADGHWVLGVAHDDSELPPTLVSTLPSLALCIN